MKISYNWLKQFVNTDWDSEKTSELLTDLGLEVEGTEVFQSVKGGLEGVVVGHVLECTQHPNADRLKLTMVDIGADEPLKIVNFNRSALGCCVKEPKSCSGYNWYYIIFSPSRGMEHKKR